MHALKFLRYVVVLMFVFSVTTPPTPCPAQDNDIADLEEQLKNGLLARAPNELEFISKVVGLVEAKTLDVATVKAAFQYAVPKKPRPFPFFQRALQILAKQKGIDI